MAIFVEFIKLHMKWCGQHAGGERCHPEGPGQPGEPMQNS